MAYFPNTSVFLVVLCMYVLTTYGNIQFEPVIASPGTIKIICLLDLHSSASPTDITKCSKPKSNVLQMAFVALWELENVLRDSSISDIGISIYDTCGSQERAVRILSSAVADPQFQVGGVISYVDPSVTPSITGILRHLNLLHIDITDDVTSCRKDSNCLSISLASRAKAEAVLEFTRSLNWTYVTTVSLPNTRGVAEEQLFADILAMEKNVCLSARHVVKDIPEATNAIKSSKSMGVVVFSGDAFLGGPLSVDDKKTAIIVSKYAGNIPVQTNYLNLATNSATFEGLKQYLSNFNNEVTYQWIRDTRYFQEQCMVAGSDVKFMIYSCIQSESSPESLAILDAVGVISAAIVNANMTTCRNFDVVTCPALSLATSSSFVGDVAKFHQKSGASENLLVERNTEVILTSSVSWPLEITEVQTQHGTIQLPSSLPMSMYQSQCRGFCAECTMCQPYMTSSERVVMQQGSVYIVGVFPIHTSVSGPTCTDPNIQGFHAAQAFSAAVDHAIKTGLAKDLPTDISLGWAMFDSCGDPEWFERKYDEIETCLYKYKDANEKEVVFQPHRTIAYFNLGENPTQEFSKLTATVSPLGVGIGDRGINQYASSVVSVLTVLDWTYISVIISSETTSKNFFNKMQEHADAKDICFEDVYRISTTATTQNAVKDSMDTKTIVLVTNVSDTKEVLKNLPRQKKYQLLLFGWNVEALRDTNTDSLFSQIVVVWPRSSNNDLPEGGIQDSGNPWYEGFQTMTNNSAPKDFFETMGKSQTGLIVDAVNMIVEQINSAFVRLCPEKDVVCEKFTDLMDLKLDTKPRPQMRYEISTLKSPREEQLVYNKIGEVNSDGIANLVLDGTVILPQASKCEGWCPRCKECKGSFSSSTKTLYLPGDFLVAGVLPLREAGSEGLMCGEVSTSTESEQAVEAFMFAVETYTKRYPYLLPNVRVGGVVIDSCSEVNVALQSMGNFETCMTRLGTDTGSSPHPAQTLGYVLHDNKGRTRQLQQCATGADKLSVSTTTDGDVSGSYLSTEYEDKSEVSALMQTIRHLNWTHITLVVSDEELYKSKSNMFLTQATTHMICVSKLLRLNGTVLSSLHYTASQLALTGFVPIVVMASKVDTVKLLDQDSVTRVNRPWLISSSGSDWTKFSDLNFPYGTLILDRKGKLSSEFAEFYSNFHIGQNSSDWWRQYWQEKMTCSMSGDLGEYALPCPKTTTGRQTTPSQLATRIILSVDVILHAVHNQYVASCEEKNGFCRQFAAQGRNRIADAARSVTFEFEDEIIRFSSNGLLVSTYNILSVHPHTPIAVGEWRNGQLHIDVTKLYNRNNNISPNVARCLGNCICVNNINVTRSSAHAEAVFWESTGRFNSELWGTIIVAISAAGAFVTVILIFYVLYKVCAGALAKRYVGLGLLLLLGVLMLYLSVLPFVFTPSNTICALRFFAPGFTYCLCFATVLVKMTSIRDYKLIGLGGEVSNLNQFLSVFFISSVQIAIGVQYWVLKSSFVTEKMTGDKVLYACTFRRNEFLVYLVYVMFVLLLGAIYGIGVRKEQKNMGEARLLMTSSWLCVCVWLSWTIVLMVLDISLSDPIITAGILACATLILTVIFIPKIHMVARLKYDVSKHTSTMQNGYKVDPDFMFERPYSLPGTLTSSYSSVKTYPKSIEHFDSSLSY